MSLQVTKQLEIAEMAKRVRRKILDMSYQAGGGAHLGGGLSMVEIMTTLYSAVMNLDPKKSEENNRDRFILSKGHGVLGFFPVLAEMGLISDQMLTTYKKNESELISHPIMNPENGIESSNGSLGHGLSMASGLAWASKKRNFSSKIFVLMGDGECNEGSVWEAAMLSTQLRLDNLIAIVDFNKYQSDGISEDIINLNNLPQMWRALGWEVEEVDGHDIASLYSALNSKSIKAPKVVIAHTIKGKGVKFMENDNSWHHGRLTEKTYKQALEQLY